MNVASSETLLINFISEDELPAWRERFSRPFPDLHLARWDDCSVDPDRVSYVLVWKPEPGRLAQFPNLKVIMSEAAGVDHILSDPLVPRHVPITRMVTAETLSRMADYVTMAAYMLMRQMPDIIHAQRQSLWSDHLTGRLASETRVGILGLGQLGTGVASRLLANGFKVNGWSRRGKQIADVQSFSGSQQLASFLRQSDILVNLLPDTVETRDIISDELLNQLPAGAGIINVGRGHQLNVAALLRALASGQIKGAVLDVFAQEPLPADDPLWQHPGIIITGHVASLISNEAKAEQAMAIIRADRDGLPLPLLYNREWGY